MAYYGAYDATYGPRIDKVRATHEHIIINSFEAARFFFFSKERKMLRHTRWTSRYLRKGMYNVEFLRD